MTEPLREPLPLVLCWIQGLGRKPHSWRAGVSASAAGHRLSPMFFLHQRHRAGCTNHPVVAAQTLSFWSQTPESPCNRAELLVNFVPSAVVQGLECLGDAVGPHAPTAAHPHPGSIVLSLPGGQGWHCPQGQMLLGTTGHEDKSGTKACASLSAGSSGARSCGTHPVPCYRLWNQLFWQGPACSFVIVVMAPVGCVMAPRREAIGNGLMGTSSEPSLG